MTQTIISNATTTTNNTNIDRKLDTRKKIMLGGLFVKAGLDHFYPYDPATLFGMLLYCKKAMEIKPELLAKWKSLGFELIEKTEKVDHTASIPPGDEGKNKNQMLDSEESASSKKNDNQINNKTNKDN